MALLFLSRGLCQGSAHHPADRSRACAQQRPDQQEVAGDPGQRVTNDKGREIRGLALLKLANILWVVAGTIEEKVDNEQQLPNFRGKRGRNDESAGVEPGKAEDPQTD
jgi:hypothetical protein